MGGLHPSVAILATNQPKQSSIRVCISKKNLQPMNSQFLNIELTVAIDVKPKIIFYFHSLSIQIKKKNTFIFFSGINLIDEINKITCLIPWWHLSCPQQLTNAHALSADRKNVAKAPCTDALEKADKEKEKNQKTQIDLDSPPVYELLFLSFELDYLVSLLFVA